MTVLNKVITQKDVCYLIFLLFFAGKVYAIYR